MAIGVGGLTVEAEAPLAPRVALELSAGRVFLGRSEGSIWTVEDANGTRLAAVLKFYERQPSGLHEGFFFGPYFRYSDIDFERSRTGFIFTSEPESYRLRKFVIGGLTGYTHVLPSGVTFSTAAGIGYTLSRNYGCLPTAPRQFARNCQPEFTATRDADLHLYFQLSFGFRLHFGETGLIKEEAELLREEEDFRLEGIVRDYEERAGDGSEVGERPPGLSDLKWRRLQHKLRYRARRRD